jgi:Raf kinase inhibitor-like YbhB/YbcL family protein
MTKKVAVVIGIALTILVALGVLFFLQQKQNGGSNLDEDFSTPEVDEHGCQLSEGFLWCEETQSCYREWDGECPGGGEEIRIMNITSPDFLMNEPIPAKYTCDGENISPTLEWSGYPEETVSMVLIVDDPDAAGGDWVHWLMWNINPTERKIGSDSAPRGAIIGVNSFGDSKYSGPCPPTGTHNYQFKLYALDSELELDVSSEKKDVLSAMDGHVLDKVLLVGTYSKD